MKALRRNLLFGIPFDLRQSAIHSKFSRNVIELVSEGRAETWDTLFLITDKIKNELMNEITTQ